MRRRREFIVACAVLSAVRFPVSALALDYHLERITTTTTPTFNQPTFLTQAPGDPANILYYTTRITGNTSGFGGGSNTTGSIWRYDLNTRTSTEILNIRNLDNTTRAVGSDNGLQTIAFNPDFNNATSSGYGKVYVSSAQNGTTSIDRVEEYTILNATGGFNTQAQALATQRLVLKYDNNNQNNHTVGWIGFNPTAVGAERNYLYISTGDGSFGNAYNGGTSYVDTVPNPDVRTGRPSQNPSDPKGKILRIDISGGDDYPADALKNFAIPASNPIPTYNAAHPGSPIMGSVADASNNLSPAPAIGEVYASGMRNGYRISFDRNTGDIYMGDVGEDTYEEVDFLKAGTNPNGPPADFGWPQFEGMHNSTPSGAPHNPTNPFTGVTSINPLQEWRQATIDNTLQGAAIGGYLYRGPIPELQGKYFYTDFVTGQVWMLDFDPNTNPAAFNGRTGVRTDVTLDWAARLMDPNDPSYSGDATLLTQRGLDHIVSFGEDNLGNLYVVDFSFQVNATNGNFNGQYNANVGEIFRVVPNLIVAPGQAVWTGDSGNRWDALSGTNTNFNTTPTSGVDASSLPAYITDVVFASTAPAAANFNTILGRDFFVKSVTVASGSPAVSIGSSTTATQGTNTLVIMGAGGITVASGSGGLTISSNLTAGASQTWTNNATTSLLITGNITIQLPTTGDQTVSLAGSINATGALSILSGRMIISDNQQSIAATGGTAAIQIGTATSQGALIVNAGSVASSNQIWVSINDGGYGALINNGGTITTGSWLAVARGGGSAIFNVNGGAVNVNAPAGQRLTVGSFQGDAGVLHASATFTGGTINIPNSDLYVGENNNAVVTLAGNAIVNVGGVDGARLAVANTVTGILNLNGGVLTTRRLWDGGTASTRVSIVNFNGGTLVAGASPNADFMSALNNAYVYPGGAFIDTGAQSIIIAQTLEAPTGNGVGSIALSGGTGYFAPPLVALTGGGGTGATAIANVDSSGNLTGISITNPGVGYATAPTVAFSGGGGALTGTASTVTLSPNTAGGLTKLGTGTLNLTGVATFGGNVSIAAGQLTFDTNSTSSSTIGTVSGAGRLLVNANAVVTSKGVTLADTWTINGKHFINTGVGDIGTSKVLAVPVIAHTGSGTSASYSGVLQLADNKLIVQSTSSGDKTSKITALNEAINAGSNGATWTGNGITSSTAQGDPNHIGVGVFDNGILNKTSFGGQPTDTNSIFVAVAHLGDTNRNNIVDIQDISVVANNWQQSRNTWTQGDLNRDGIVNIQDSSIIANNWQQTSNFSETASLLGVPAGVPEPASLLVLSALVPLLVRRRVARGRRLFGKQHDT